MAATYQETNLVSEEAKVLLKLEEMLGEPIPKKKNSINLKFGFVAKNNHVIALGLTKKNLKILPENIGELKELEELFLPDNNLSTLPASLTDLKNLLRLDLWNNNLSESSFNKNYSRLVNLHYLELRNNDKLENIKTFGSYHENSFKTKNDVKAFLNRFRK